MKATEHQHRDWLKGAALALLMLCLSPRHATADTFYGYTEEQPLIIAGDWDFQPYEYLNNDGQPAGYNVEVLNKILDKLKIPHKFALQEWHRAAETFERHDADLIHALAYAYMSHPYVLSKNFINYYNISVARRVDTPPLLHIKDLDEGDTLIMKNNDYADLRLKMEGDLPFTVVYRSPKDGLYGVYNKSYTYYVWGEIPLSRKLQELALDSIALDEIDIPAGDLRIVGFDRELINVIDDEYARLEQSGELEKIRDKWFHPERVHNDASPIALLIVLGAFVFGVIAFLLSRLITLRVKNTVNHLVDLNNMRTMALSMGEYYVVEFDLKEGILRNQYGKMLPEEGMNPQEFLSRMPPEQSKELHQKNSQLISGELKQFDMHLSQNVGTKENPQWKEYYGNAILESEKGVPKYIVYTTKDITREMEEERTNQQVASKYMKVFDTNIVAMSFYSAEGMLIYLNDQMRELCGFDGEGEQYFRSVSMYDIELFKGDFDPRSREPLHVCQHMHYPELGIDKYIEFRILPVFDDSEALKYYLVTARDITGERIMYMEMRRHDHELQETNKVISEYELQLRYLLEQSNMFVWHYDIKERRINYSRSLRDVEFSEDIEDFFAGVPEEERAASFAEITGNMERGESFNTIHHYNYTPLADAPAWYAISGMPTRSKDGSITGYFGIARDITDLMDAQQKLKEETARAEDSGRLKAAFLANMTHEIRTPLNAIVGFSDILQMVDAPEERMEFIRIIRNNCDMLLRLINDILEASSMGQALAIEPKECDFAQVFDDICQTLEQRVAEAGVPFVKDNPYDTFPATLDKGRIQQVLTNFTTNAVKYTHEGHIKVGYRQEPRTVHGKAQEGIYFYCEDTGAGIPKEKQAAVFERFVKLNDFVQGTGLGLSICKSIAERCGGMIGVTSEGEGHGSTFWFWIPQ